MILLLCFSLSSFSHPSGNKKSPKDFNDARTVIEISHETIEGDETGRFLEDWKESLNFKKKVIESIRVNKQFQHYSTSDVLLDSLILFSLSHSLEVLSGPMAVNYGLANEWAPWLIYSAGIIGGIISVPGLDPLCILIFATYKSSEHFRKGIKTIRVIVAKPFKIAANFMQLEQWAKKTLIERSWMSEITANKNFHRYYYKESTSRSTYVFQYPISPFEAINFHLSSKDGSLSLDQLEIPKSIFKYGYSQKQLDSWLKDFGWNIKNFVLQSINSYQQKSALPERSYIKSIKDTEEWLKIELESDVINRSKAYQLKSCRWIFSH